jgi:hypothetical protein
MESGETYDDPSEDLLFELLSDIERGDEEFFVVERLASVDGQTYAQVRRTDGGQYQVEHRDGGPDRHFQVFTPDMRLAHTLITGWAFELPGWREAVSWDRIELAD